MEIERSYHANRPSRVRRAAIAVERRWRLVLGAFLTVTAGAWLALSLIGERFESETSLVVLSGEDLGGDPSNSATRGLAAEIRVLRSRRLIDKVVDQLGPEVFDRETLPRRSFVGRLEYYPRAVFTSVTRWVESELAGAGLTDSLTDRERAVLRLEKSLSVAADERSGVVTIRLRLHDPRLCAEALEVLIEKYLETQIDVRRNLEVADQLKRKVLGLEASLGTIHATREELFEARNAADVEEEVGLFLGRLSQTLSRRDVNRSERRMLSKQREEMMARFDTFPEQIRSGEVLSRNPVRETMEQRITELKLQRQDLLSRFQQSAPPVAKVEEEIAGLEALLQREEPTTLESATMEIHPVRREFTERIEALDVRITGLDAESLELERQAERLAQELHRLQRSRAGLESLERARDEAKKSYAAFSTRRLNAEILGELEQMRVAAVAVLSPPGVPLAPVYPNKLLVLAIAVPAGILLGLGLAVASENIDERVEGEWSLVDVGDFEFLGTYVLREFGRSGPSLERWSEACAVAKLENKS
jgi:uncharacterized protein involved in exopolysaccharide biosynthesis